MDGPDWWYVVGMALLLAACLVAVTVLPWVGAVLVDRWLTGRSRG